MTIASKQVVTAADILSVQAKANIAEADAIHAQQRADAAYALALSSSGQTGAPGSVWREGNGPPASIVGIQGDLYLDGLTGDVYIRGPASYSVVCNIKGIPGTPGGPQGPAGVGVVSGSINGSGHLIIAKTDGSTFDAGLLPSNVTTLASIPQTGAATGQGIQWNGSMWAPGTFATTLASLPQTGATTGQAILWNGSIWQPGTVVVSQTLGGLPQTGATTGQAVVWNGTTWAPGSVVRTIAGLPQTAATTGQAIVWSGSQWQPGTVAASQTLAGLPQTGATTGQAVVWNGTAWAPGTVSGGSGGGVITVPSGVTGVLDGAGLLTFTYANGDTAKFVGIYDLGPPVLPAGVSPNSLSVINVAPGTVWPNLGTALLGLADNGTVNIAAGHYLQSCNVDPTIFPTGITINGAGAYLTILDGRGGIGAGHRLAQGKGVILVHGNATINNVGFVGGGAADRVSDGEAGFYFDGNVGTVLINRCAFDNNENGIFANNATAGGGGSLTVQYCNFGKNISNSQAGDGGGHDNYIQCDFITYMNNIFYGSIDGHNLKVRNTIATLVTNGNYFGRKAGRCVDIPSGSSHVWTSGATSADTFTNWPGASTNCIGYADESSGTGWAGATITNAKLDIGRFDSVIWNNGPGSTLTFVTPTQTWFTDAGTGLAPTLNIQGPGSVVGITTTVGTVNPTGIAAPASPL
jgi:hypothetical protein